MERPRIYADFNASTEVGGELCLVLNRIGTRRDLERLGLELTEGLEVTFYMDDGDDDGNEIEIEVDGIVKYDALRYGWVGVVDFEKVRWP